MSAVPDLKTEWCAKIKSLHDEMRELTLQAGVHEKSYDKVLHRLEKKPEDYVWGILEFLQNVHDREYAEVKRIWTLPFMTPEVWNNYTELFSDTKFEEVTLLKAARKTLKGRFSAFRKNRPRRPRKTNSTATVQPVENQGLACDGDAR